MKFFGSNFTSLILCLLPQALLAQVQLNPNPTRVLGQTKLQITNFNANLVEGRELDSPEGVALDKSVNPPYLYVSDTGNNRVLGFRNSASFANGQHADIVIGQLDFGSTFPQGPGRGRSTGLSAPVGLAVDNQGNLYVADAGNNRILRYPQPFAQTDISPDLVIGQSSFSTGTAADKPSATSYLTNNGTVFQAYLAFDANGNLWATDPGDNRILRYPASALGSNASNGPAADLVLGQTDFITNTYVNLNNDPRTLLAVHFPTGIAFDQAGRLFVSESVNASPPVRGRVLVYTPPFTTGQSANRLLGVSVANPPLPTTSEFQFNGALGNVFMIGNNPAVVDTLNSRILVFKPFDQWTSDTLTQPAQLVIGQQDFTGSQPNRGQPEAAGERFALPIDAIYSGSELFVADSGNNRVIPLAGNLGVGFQAATRVLGQDGLMFNAVNLIEGREFHFSAADSRGAPTGDAGMVVDNTSSVPHFYVADTYNNRVLGYTDIRRIKTGDRADIVIGQPDFQRAIINYPSNDVNKPNASGLFIPTGLAVDSAGNLFVADSGNARVLRFPRPFDNPQVLPAADLVLGQSSFSSKITDPSARTMAAPYGLAFANDNGLLVSDTQHNRVLFFAGKASSFTSGMAASKVFGQADFNSGGIGAEDNRMNFPHHLATDTDDRLYVTDTNNNRVTIFDSISRPGNETNARAATAIGGLGNPRGIYVSPTTGEIWVADLTGNRVVRYSKFNDLVLNGATPTASIPEQTPRAVTLDANGNLYVADSANRVVIHFPGLAPINDSNFLPRALAPGTVVALFSFGNLHQFGSATGTASSLPLPTTLAGIQVLVNGIPAPLYYVGPDQINFLVPMTAPTSGTADLQTVRADTGQVLGSLTVQVNVASPGLFTLNQRGDGQVAAINEDGSINGPDHPAPQGSIVQFFGTGQGLVPGAPPDGAAPSGPISTPQKPMVVIGTVLVPDANVTYSGLAPGLPGVWQVNVKIPDTVAPTASLPDKTTVVAFVLNSIATNGDSIVGRRVVTMWVKAR